MAQSGHTGMSARCPLMGWTRRAPAPASRIAGSGLQNQEHSMPHNTSRLEAVATIGIDIGKNTFHLVGLDRNGAIVLRQKLSRRQIEARLANTPPCLIGMEACVGAHHLSRQLKAYGHDARLMPARYVRPYSKGQKNQFRAFLLERGIAVRQGPPALRSEIPIVLSMTDKLSPRMIQMIEDLCADWRYLDERVETVSDEIKTLSEQDDGAKRLMTVPGIGPIISTATVAAIGRGDVFSKGRDFGAWLGLVPRQMSTGGRTVLGPISKRGNRYLRMLFVQAARAVLLRPQSWGKHGLKSWIEAAARRLNRFKLAIALANKIARIVWGVLHGGRNFEVRTLRPALQAA